MENTKDNYVVQKINDVTIDSTGCPEGQAVLTYNVNVGKPNGAYYDNCFIQMNIDISKFIIDINSDDKKYAKFYVLENKGEE